ATEAVGAEVFGEKDVVEVAVVQARPALSLRLTATPVGVDREGVLLRSLPIALKGDERAAVDQLLGQPVARARFTLHPALHVPADLRALGMCLFALLLAGPKRPLSAVHAAVVDVTQQVARFVRNRSDGKAGRLTREVVGLLSEGGAEGPFSRVWLFADPAG